MTIAVGRAPKAEPASPDVTDNFAWSLRASATALALFAFIGSRYLGLIWLPGILVLAAGLVGALSLPAAARLRGRLPTPPSFRPALMLLLPMAAVALVAAAASRQPELQSYWGWFFLWVASMSSVPFLCGARLRLGGLAQTVAVHRHEAGFLLLLTAGALFLRGINLGTVPSPFSGDEAAHALRGLEAAEGFMHNMFRSGLQGTPTLYYFLLGAFEEAGGVSAVAARSSSVVLGTLAVVATYFFLRELYGRPVAIAGAIFLACYHFHIQFSRQVMLNVSDTLVLPLVLLFAYRAMKNGRTLDYALMGLLCGLSLYGWASVRILPVQIGAFWGCYMIANRRLLPDLAPGLAVLALSALIAGLPLGWWWLHNLDEFNTRWNEVGVFQSPSPAVESWFEGERERGRGTVAIFRGQVQGTLDAVFLDREDFPHYRPPQPLVDHLTFILFAIGVGWTLPRMRNPVYFVLPVLLLTPLIGAGLFTSPPASAARFLGIITPVAAYVGIGAVRIGELLAGPDRTRAGLVAVAAVAVLSVFSLDFYFGRYAHGDYFSDTTTRIATRYGETAQEVVPSGALVYWRTTDVVNPGHPALDFGLRDYVVHVVDAEGKLGRAFNPYRLPENSTTTAYMFAGKAVPNEAAFERDCPGGRLTASRNPLNGLIDLLIYVSPSEPCVLGPASGVSKPGLPVVETSQGRWYWASG